MNDKNYFITMALAGIVLAASLIYLAETTDAFMPGNETATEELQIPQFEPVPEQTLDCTLCHKQPENLTQHVTGGNYCAACHGTELHDLHKTDADSSLTCSTCHGSIATVPERLPGHTVICDSCHGYPDPLSPSYGNLITIHIARGKTCDICHVQDLQSLHRVKSQ